MTLNHDLAMNRRNLFMLGGGAALALTIPGHREGALAQGAAPAVPVQQLDNALIASMRAGRGTSFSQRYTALAPVIEQAFNLDDILARSVGFTWANLPPAQRAELGAAFRRYTVSSYLANFDSYNGQSFQILPEIRTVGNGQYVVQTRLVRPGESAIPLDYVVAPGPRGPQIVDVLTNGTISRVAIQRSDFRTLLNSGGVPALTASLQSKVSSLSGG